MTPLLQISTSGPAYNLRTSINKQTCNHESNILLGLVYSAPSCSNIIWERLQFCVNVNFEWKQKKTLTFLKWPQVQHSLENHSLFARTLHLTSCLINLHRILHDYIACTCISNTYGFKPAITDFVDHLRVAEISCKHKLHIITLKTCKM